MLPCPCVMPCAWDMAWHGVSTTTRDAHGQGRGTTSYSGSTSVEEALLRQSSLHEPYPRGSLPAPVSALQMSQQHGQHQVLLYMCLAAGCGLLQRVHYNPLMVCECESDAEPAESPSPGPGQYTNTSNRGADCPSASLSPLATMACSLAVRAAMHAWLP